MGRLQDLIQHRSSSLGAIATFLLGVSSTQILGVLYPEFDTAVVAVGILTVSVALLGLANQGVLGRLTAEVGRANDHVVRSHSMTVRFIDDNDAGRSYNTIEALTKNARRSVTFVDLWEPFVKYQVDDAAATSRAKLYETLEQQAQACRDGEIRHERLVQVSDKLWSAKEERRIPFDLDPLYANYLKTVVSATRSADCNVKVAPEMFRLAFAIIDDLHVVLPILAQDIRENRQSRYGALLIEDREGDLIRELKRIIRAIDKRSRPLELDDFDEPPIDLRAVGLDLTEGDGEPEHRHEDDFPTA